MSQRVTTSIPKPTHDRAVLFQALPPFRKEFGALKDMYATAVEELMERRRPIVEADYPDLVKDIFPEHVGGSKRKNTKTQRLSKAAISVPASTES